MELAIFWDSQDFLTASIPQPYPKTSGQLLPKTKRCRVASFTSKKEQWEEILTQIGNMGVSKNRGTQNGWFIMVPNPIKMG